MKKQSYFSGHFYPSSKEELEDFFRHFNEEKFSSNLKNIKAIIVPHAGYVYSGSTANAVYSLCEKQHFKRVVVLGPSHRIAFEGVSIGTFTSYETPFGYLKIDEEFVKTLKDKFDFAFFHEDCHKEHSTETQMPFIAYYLKNVQVVEIVYSRVDLFALTNMLDFILQEDETLLIISTDLSHFHDLQTANKLDSVCIEAIKSQDLSLLDKDCEACGMQGLKALLSVSKKHHLKSEVKSYKTSFERNRDKSSVVGYVSAIVGMI